MRFLRAAGSLLWRAAAFTVAGSLAVVVGCILLVGRVFRGTARAIGPPRRTF